MRDSVKYQQEFITAVSYERVSLSYAFFYDIGCSRERHVTGIMSVCIVIKLEIIKVDHGYAGSFRLFPLLILIIPPVIRSCKRIHIQFFVISYYTRCQLTVIIHIRDHMLVYMLQQLHNIGLAVYFNIPGKYLKYLLAKQFKLCSLTLFSHSPQSGTIAAMMPFIPKCVTFTVSYF